MAKVDFDKIKQEFIDSDENKKIRKYKNQSEVIILQK